MHYFLFWQGLLEPKAIFWEDLGRKKIMRMQRGKAKEVNNSTCRGGGVKVGFYEDTVE